MTLLLLAPTALAAAPVLPNPSFDHMDTPSVVPNDIEPMGWQFVDGASLAHPDAAIDCRVDLLPESPDGGHYARALSFQVQGQNTRQAVGTEVRDLLLNNVPYVVRFDAALVRNWGQSSGRWRVVMGQTVIDGPVIAIGNDDPGVSTWRRQTVGPFFAAAETELLGFVALTGSNGTTAPQGACTGDSGITGASDLLLDGIEVSGDDDLDGLYRHEEEAFGSDPERADTDSDLLEDGDEYALGTRPDDPDTDGDGFFDGEEVFAGTDPLDPSDFPEPANPLSTGDTGNAEKVDWVGYRICSCSSTKPSSALVTLLALGLLLWRRRRGRNPVG